MNKKAKTSSTNAHTSSDRGKVERERGKEMTGKLNIYSYTFVYSSGKNLNRHGPYQAVRKLETWSPSQAALLGNIRVGEVIH